MRRNQVPRAVFEKLPPERKVISLLRPLSREPQSGEPLLSTDERDYYASAFDASGFTGAINWYRNWKHNWEVLEGVDHTIDIPTLFIGAVDDLIIAPEHIEAMRPLVTDIEIHVLEHCGHWSQQEKPDEVNRLILEWLVQRR
jgi:pimeloyl-ACP methyl ester carboxylesterase